MMEYGKMWNKAKKIKMLGVRSLLWEIASEEYTKEVGHVSINPCP